LFPSNGSEQCPQLTSLPAGDYRTPLTARTVGSQAGDHLTPTFCSPLHCSSQLVPLIAHRHGPHRKHCASLLYFSRYRRNMLICEAVTRQRLVYICLSRGCYNNKHGNNDNNEHNFHTLRDNGTMVTYTIVSRKHHVSVCIFQILLTQGRRIRQTQQISKQSGHTNYAQPRNVQTSASLYKILSHNSVT
jgi:hypothetical protein